MADKKISQLSSASTPLAGTEVLPIVQSSTTVKVATDDLTVKNVRSNATTGILQIAGPAAAATRTMTVPDANFTVARTDAAQTFTGDQTFSTVLGTTFDTNVTAAKVTLSGTTLAASGTDTDIGITLTPKGTGVVNTSAVTATSTITAGKLVPTANDSTGNGMYLSAANTVAISTNGSPRITVESDGDVLVGTTSDTGAVANTASVVGGYFRTQRGSNASVANDTFVTLVDLNDNGGLYIFQLWVGGNATNSSAWAVIAEGGAGGTTPIILTQNDAGGGSVFQISGSNVQAKQLTGGAATINWSYLRLF